MLAAESALNSAVARAVEAALANGSILPIGEVTKQIRSQNPGCVLPARQVADLLTRKAIVAGVPVHFTSPD